VVSHPFHDEAVKWMGHPEPVDELTSASSADQTKGRSVCSGLLFWKERQG